ncbi:polysaccharide deacetylase family protein [Streptomyces sp. 196(2019)]|uniref:polysaccharide deacetylase family protein n=1 Tax=Streptomyces sp. 196(2019) TaxID=2683820 RepID=UPI0013ED43EA|nr:polysaccharide deacetylase family protein [Streptomyces sp. 196(2019)]NGO82126.1 polysaccharide deacetylase family protein [Streptomyces sp. 196(2019)]
MTTLTVAGVLLGGALGGCGGGTPAPAPVATPPAAAASPAPPKKPPTMAPGPEGRTPVFERRPATAAVAGGSPSDEKVVALSFDADMTADQGPRAKAGERFDNPELIALLRRLKVPATVFMTGRWAEEYPAQAKDIGADGLFEVANHSYSHHAFTADCYGLPVVAKETMAADVERAFAAFREAGVRNVVPYFRFPGGCYDDAALRALAPANVTAVQWDVVSGDAFATDAGAVARQVLDGVRPGSLVVLHCTRSAAPVTGEAVGRIVPELRKRGYRFVKVSELMEG